MIYAWLVVAVSITWLVGLKAGAHGARKEARQAMKALHSNMDRELLIADQRVAAAVVGWRLQAVRSQYLAARLETVREHYRESRELLMHFGQSLTGRWPIVKPAGLPVLAGPAAPAALRRTYPAQRKRGKRR